MPIYDNDPTVKMADRSTIEAIASSWLGMANEEVEYWGRECEVITSRLAYAQSQYDHAVGIRDALAGQVKRMHDEPKAARA